MSVDVYYDGEVLCSMANGRMRLHRGTVEEARAIFASSTEPFNSDAGPRTPESLLAYFDRGAVDPPFTLDEWRGALRRFGRLP